MKKWQKKYAAGRHEKLQFCWKSSRKLLIDGNGMIRIEGRGRREGEPTTA